MPVAVSYPGVYVEEIPSGVRTITGVATSITAFIGRARRGATNDPITINSFGDFEREFGGLGEKYPMSYAVKDFYLNGGSQAIIVRLYHVASEEEKAAAGTAAQSVAEAAAGVEGNAAAVAAAARAKANSVTAEPGKAAADIVADAAEAAAKVKDAPPAAVKTAATDAAAAIAGLPGKAQLKIGEITLEAVSVGSWGNNLRARVEGSVPKEVTDRYGLAEGEMFNLLVHDTATGVTERFMNVSVKPSVRQLDKVLENDSNLVKVGGSMPATVPKPTDEGLSNDELKFQPFENKKDNKRSVKVADANKAFPDIAINETDYKGIEADKTGLRALDKVDLFNLLCVPPDTRDGSTDNDVYQAAIKYCVDRRAMLIVDPPNTKEWSSVNEIIKENNKALMDLGLSGTDARNGAIFFPRVLQSDPNREGQIDTFVPCGIIAGVMARTDATRGVWKAPAGIDAAMNGVQGLSVNLSDPENGMLNPLGINCLRSFPVFGRVVWGARTLRGADQLADEYKYIPVRRTALYIEESLFRGLKWVVFESNDEPLWSQIRLNAGAFMHNLFRQGAFQGTTPKDAYFVKCDKETTTQNDVNLGIVNVVVGFAPLKPAEFVIIKIQQMAGQIEV
jgi:hypothetical protein